MSIDGFGAGPDQSLEHPMGKGGRQLPYITTFALSDDVLSDGAARRLTRQSEVR